MENTSDALSPHAARFLGILYSSRRLIVGVGIAAAILSVIISLLLPKYYLGTARVLLPEGSSGGGLTALLGDLAPTAASLLGSSGAGDFDRFRAILSSRTVQEEVVARFDLTNVYELADNPTPMFSTLKVLRSRTEFAIDPESGYLSIQVLDRTPERAAEMANFLVDLLNERNAELLAQSAKQNRIFMATMLADNENRLDSARTAQYAFQKRYGIIDLPTQTQAFFETIAILRTEVLKAKIQYEASRQQLGAESATTRGAEAVYRAANNSYISALNGSEVVLPIAQDSVAIVARQYAEVTQEVMVQEELFRFLRPLYEQSRFDEQREKTAVQVMDRAIPPEVKDRPKRSIIVVSATMSIVLLTVLLLFVRYWMREYGKSALDQVKRAARH